MSIHMVDIFDNPILCNECNLKTSDITINKNGYIIRAKKCPECSLIIEHPLDLQEYQKDVL